MEKTKITILMANGKEKEVELKDTEKLADWYERQRFAGMSGAKKRKIKRENKKK